MTDTHETHKSKELSEAVANKNTALFASKKSRMIFSVVVTTALVAFGSVLATAYYMNHYSRHYTTLTDNTVFDGGFGRGGMMSRFTYSTTDGNNSTTTDYIRTDGVVSATGTDSFTMIGRGTSTTVKTTSSTVFNGSSMPVKANDSVIVVGTQDGSTITATSVYIIRQ